MVVVPTSLPGLEPAATVARLPAAVTFRRRRLAALAVLVVLVAAPTWGVARVAAALGDGPASVAEHRPAPVVHVVERGDTLWSIARGLQPEGDVRPLVRALLQANGGPELQVGQRLVLP